MKISFSRRTDLALAALRDLDRAQSRLSRALLAREIGTTASFLTQVMAPLVQAGWVSSERGPGGGYRLSSEAYDIRLLEVIEATEGPALNGRCVMRDGPCPGEESCPIHEVWVEARNVLVGGLDRVPALQAPY